MSKYKGYLIKTEYGILPGKFITGYDSTPNQETDRNSYTDANGKTHRNILKHTKSGITFTLPPLTLEEKEQFQKYFPERYKMKIEYWNDAENTYAEGIFYITPIKYTILNYDKKTIYYSLATVELIEY